jgi:SOS response regulatory protein OraA/RecX
MSRNRPKPDSRKYWIDLALFYCSKRETSRSRLRAYFLRKIREYQIPVDEIPRHLEWIDSVLDQCEQNKIIDHERYAGILHRDLERRGKGRRYVEQKLKERGLSEEFKKLEFDRESEVERACALAGKTLGSSRIRKLTDAREIRSKVLQKLVSNGFDLETAKQAVTRALNPRDRD